MARYVYEVMNPELFSLAPDIPANQAMGHILALQITAAPVVDADGYAVGVASLRDLIAAKEGGMVAEVMSSPAVVVDRRATIEAASRLLSETGLHRLVVVDERRRAAGVVSAIDLVRALMGLPVVFPEAFPHYDWQTGATWTDDTPLSLDSILRVAPDAPGLLVLVHGGRGVPELIVWAEAAHNVAARLVDIVSGPQPEFLEQILKANNLRFRAARIADEARREQALDEVQRKSRAKPMAEGASNG